MSARSSRTRASGWIFAALFVAAGCRQILGLDDRPRPEGGACGAIAIAPDTCDACVRRSCCAEVAACAADADCKLLHDCLATCPPGDEACRAECRAATSGAVGAAAADLESCEAALCAPECKLECGGYVFPTSACATCAQASCCGPSSDCTEDRGCMALGVCERACAGDADVYGCLGDCQRAYPDAVATARALGDCLADACLAACGDPAWRCLDDVAWPPGATQSTTLFVRLKDIAGTQPPLSGLEMRLCKLTDKQCDTPLAGPVTTDATGEGSFTFVPGIGPNVGFIRITGPGIRPSLLFLIGPPLTTDSLYILPLVTSADEAVLTGGIPLDPKRGVVMAFLKSCSNASPSGITFEATGVGVDASASRFYVHNGVAVTDATSTDASGIAGYFNVGEGSITLHDEVAATGQPIADVSIFTEAGAGSYVLVFPTPR
ncbi:MAG: hypothetical protein U0414_30100 [Polyangiaceae bacterium]